jgi:hypothetical protein
LIRECGKEIEDEWEAGDGEVMLIPGSAFFHGGTLGEGMRAAISEVERGYREMIEGWKRQ